MLRLLRLLRLLGLLWLLGLLLLLLLLLHLHGPLLLVLDTSSLQNKVDIRLAISHRHHVLGLSLCCLGSCLGLQSRLQLCLGDGAERNGRN